MADQEHLALLADDHPARINAASQARASGRNLDLSGANLSERHFRDMDLAGAVLDKANLAKADFRGARLCMARFEGANMQGADLSDADCNGATFREADLRGAKVSSRTILTSADFKEAQIHADILQLAQVAKAVLAGQDLSHFDLRGCDLSGANLTQSNLSGTNLSQAKLIETCFNYATMIETIFDNANLTRAQFRFADLTRARLLGANLTGAHLMRAGLSGADITESNFFEASLDGSSMDYVIGAPLARNLLTTRINQPVEYFDRAVRSWQEQWADWEKLRIFGRLPLFGASYTGLIVIPVYVYFLDIYNDKVLAARLWLEHTVESAGRFSGSAAEAVLNHLHPEPIPQGFRLLFISTICLAIASTIYTLACPSRIKTFSRDQWCDEHGHSLVHYWPEAWKWRWARMICSVMYVAGGAGAGWFLISKLYRVGEILFRSTFT